MRLAHALELQGQTQLCAESSSGTLEHVRWLGHGTFGSVELCASPSSHQLVVVKRIPLVRLQTMAGVEQLIAEVRNCAALRHANIVGLHGAHLDRSRELLEGSGHVHILLEYCAGGSLAACIEWAVQKGARRAGRTGRARARRAASMPNARTTAKASEAVGVPTAAAAGLPAAWAPGAESPAAAAAPRAAAAPSDEPRTPPIGVTPLTVRLSSEVVSVWLAQLGTAVAFMHEHKVLHRDLSASNIFLRSPPTARTRGDLVVGDLGFSKRVHSWSKRSVSLDGYQGSVGGGSAGGGAAGGPAAGGSCGSCGSCRRSSSSSCLAVSRLTRSLRLSHSSAWMACRMVSSEEFSLGCASSACRLMATSSA